MTSLLHPAYFPNIATFAVLAQQQVVWEVADNYQKQTFRNRCYICTDQGKHMITIPIKHVGGKEGRQRYKDVRLENNYPWQRQHWRTLQTAYRTSPFFEYYEEDLAPLFENKFEFLLDFNFRTIERICNCLQLQMPAKRSTTYHKSVVDQRDLRYLINAKNELAIHQNIYVQVFGERHGFIKNLSVLDLLFNEGTAALAYLQNQELKFLNA